MSPVRLPKLDYRQEKSLATILLLLRAQTLQLYNKYVASFYPGPDPIKKFHRKILFYTGIWPITEPKKVT